MSEEPINLESLKDDFLPTDHKPCEIWESVLKPGSQVTPAEAAEQINKLFPIQNKDEADREYYGRAEHFLWYFWALLIGIIELVPHEHSGQTKLVLVLEKLTQLPPTTIRAWGTEERVWTDLPFLGPCMRDNWAPTRNHDEEDSPSDYEDPITKEESGRRWMNLNSFAARMLNKRLVYWNNFAIWEVRRALETPLQPGPTKTFYVAIATEWILQGGEELFRTMSEDITEEEAHTTRAKSLFQGKHGARQDKWKFWKKRFLELSKQVDEDVGKRAIRAVEKMSELEQMKVASWIYSDCHSLQINSTAAAFMSGCFNSPFGSLPFIHYILHSDSDLCTMSTEHFQEWEARGRRS